VTEKAEKTAAQSTSVEDSEKTAVQHSMKEYVLALTAVDSLIPVIYEERLSSER